LVESKRKMWKKKGARRSGEGRGKRDGRGGRGRFWERWRSDLFYFGGG